MFLIKSKRNVFFVGVWIISNRFPRGFLVAPLREQSDDIIYFNKYYVEIWQESESSGILNYSIFRINLRFKLTYRIKELVIAGSSGYSSTKVKD